MAETYLLHKIKGTTTSANRAWLSFEVPGTSELALGWILSQPPAESGPPPIVLDFLCKLLVAYGSVVYGRPVGEGTKAQQLATLTGFEFNGLFGMFGPGVEFVWTDDAATMRQLFDTPYFLWSQESQFALMYKQHTAPSTARSALVDAFKHADFTNAGLKSSGMTAALLPGADGDFAHFVFYTDAERAAFIEIVESTCKEMNVPFEIITGQQFDDTDWYAMDPLKTT